MTHYSNNTHSLAPESLTRGQTHQWCIIHPLFLLTS